MAKRPRDEKVVKLNRTVRVNTAVIIFGIILIYVLASIVRSVTKKNITTYKVSASNINNDISCRGIAIRDETVIKTSMDGYLIYYIGDGQRVKKDSMVCTIDSTGNTISQVEESGSENSDTRLSNAALREIQEDFDNYKSSYSDVTFSSVYNFKEDVTSHVMELSSDIMREKMNDPDASSGSQLKSVTAPESGVVAYYTDGYEDKKPEDLSAADFNERNYKKVTVATGAKVKSGSSAFKLVSDENWSVVCELKEDQAKQVRGEKSLSFTLNQSENVMTTDDFSLKESGGHNFLVLNLDKYMIDYIGERFLNVELIMDRYEGLKVPVSSITKKKVYKIPAAFVDRTRDKTSNSISVLRKDEEGNQKTVSVDIVIYKSDDNYYYADTGSFEDTDILVKPDKTGSEPVLSCRQENLTGVFLANEGMAEFTEVETVKTGETIFAIVKEGGALKEYDNIVLDASQVQQNQTLY